MHRQWVFNKGCVGKDVVVHYNFGVIFDLNLHLCLHLKLGLSAAQQVERYFHASKSAREQTYPESHRQVWWMSSLIHPTYINNQNNNFECNPVFQLIR